MKRLITFIFLLLNYCVFGQIKTAGLNDNSFPTFYQQRSSLFRLLPETTGDVVFLGNSITNGNEWDELFEDGKIKNRGISGDVTAGVLNRLDEVTSRKPAKVFLLVGINDLAAGKIPDSVVQNIFLIAKRIRQETPATKLYIQSILPVNDAFNKFPNHVNKSAQIKGVDSLLDNGASANHYTYINLYPFFCNSDGKLDTLYTNDGLHEKGPGYMLWKHLIYPYVYDLQSKPSLVPEPQSVSWTNDLFPLYKCHVIEVANPDLINEAIVFQKYLLNNGIVVQIVNHPVADNIPKISLEQKQILVSGINEEAYQLSVKNNVVNITANTPHGCFNALQTLMQLMRDNSLIQGVNITDYPAFAWRGYMVDVGRNFQSVDMLKQQIEVMAKYKLNIFHLHLTEDIAWRLQIKQYPQLTEAGNMERNKGAFYSVDELKGLIDFCKERYITLIPEIDVPGHSAAFKRAFKCGMQSDTGLNIVKNILKEVCNTYNVPYLHIGGDEVKITNKQFLPTVISYVHELGKQTIGWSPGGDMDNGTIHQLWMTAGATNPQIKYIDSRNLYINHMDPLESVVSIYNRKIGDLDKGTNNLLGGELCLWPDRNVIKQEDVLTTNPVYPTMLTFAERSWKGGGTTGWHTNISRDNGEFADFENRLIDQQRQYFINMPFAYVRQSEIKWHLYGPYPNKGILTTAFAPENEKFHPQKQKDQVVTGGTIILRHFWYPEVKGVLANPKDSSTYYAMARVWSSRDTTALMWIGFYNISRSYTTSSPLTGTWDDRNSEIWINKKLISPPLWSRAGQAGDIEKPLIDEDYEYRAPSKVVLHKGWNQVLVKLPIGNFRSATIQKPVKWMFTAVFVKSLGQNFVADDALSYDND